MTTPQDLTVQLLGRGPLTVRDLAAALVKEGWHPSAVIDQARVCLTYLVEHRKAERLEIHGVDVYRLPGSTKFEREDAN